LIPTVIVEPIDQTKQTDIKKIIDIEPIDVPLNATELLAIEIETKVN
jgi:hypothetical protein